MAKFALIFLALIAVAAAKPYGGAMVGGHHQTHHVTTSSHVLNPYGLWGYGYPGSMVGHSISSHSVGHQHHVVPHYGYSMMGLYPGGMGYLLG